MSITLILKLQEITIKKCPSRNLKKIKKHQNRDFITLNRCYISSNILNKCLSYLVLILINKKIKNIPQINAVCQYFYIGGAAGS